MRRKFLSKGFTLIELLVVIAIIGVLASIVLVSLTSARAKARDAKRVSALQELQKALELYYADNGKYPTYASGCIPTWQCWANTTTNNSGAGAGPMLSASYIDMTKFIDPSQFDNGSACGRPSGSGSRLYAYYSDNGQRYVLATALENPPASTDGHYYTGTYGCSGFANYWIENGF
jgi:prepilin-type N-terminal cleavage/methylation domain-containing protein